MGWVTSFPCWLKVMFLLKYEQAVNFAACHCLRDSVINSTNQFIFSLESSKLWHDQCRGILQVILTELQVIENGESQCWKCRPDWITKTMDPWTRNLGTLTGWTRLTKQLKPPAESQALVAQILAPAFNAGVCCVCLQPRRAQRWQFLMLRF